jgi:hypothetical protein
MSTTTTSSPNKRLREEENNLTNTNNNKHYFNEQILSSTNKKLTNNPTSATTNNIPNRVRQTCLQQATISKHVHIDMDELKNLAQWIGTTRTIEWDESNWHCSEAEVGIELAIKYVFVLDALNFCFWPAQGKVEYADLAIALKKAMLHDKQSFDGKNLIQMTPAMFNSWLPLQDDGIEWPLIDERVKALRELGEAIVQYGEPIDWVIKHCNRSAAKLTDLVAERLPMFRDECVDLGICFYKRAMILVADVWAATGRRQHSIGEQQQQTKELNSVSFYDIDQLCMFSDYRVPQLLRERQVLIYSLELSKIIDERIEIKSGSQYEIEIRAASVAVVELLRIECEMKFISIEIDWLLWQEGERMNQAIRPPHHTITSFY